MRARIHRGAHEIGGNCIEIEHGEDRIVLDLGRPLSAAWDDVVPLPDIRGLASPDPHMHGVILTHPHLDHYGLASQLGDGVAVYMGAEAEKVLTGAAFFSPISRSPAVTNHLQDRTPLQLGPFTVTPYLADHSAFDAYSLLVESAGRRLFYTGDIRGHGRKAAPFDRLVASPPETDVLLMEGTNIRAMRGASPRQTETDVEDELVETFRDTGGLVAVFSSAQNPRPAGNRLPGGTTGGPEPGCRPVHGDGGASHGTVDHPATGLRRAGHLRSDPSAGPSGPDEGVPARGRSR